MVQAFSITVNAESSFLEIMTDFAKGQRSSVFAPIIRDRGYSDLPFALDQGLQADEKRGFYCIMYI